MLRHRIHGVLLMLVVSAFVSGIATDVPAKTEGGGTPAGAKEIPPYIEGTLILLADGTASFVGECVTAFDTRFFNVQFNLDIQVAVASGGSNPNNSVEGTIVRSLSVPAGCFKDGATSVDVVIKSVKNFTPDAPPGSRTSIVARIAVARFV